MVSWLNKALDDVINTIINSDDYKSCILLKEKMSTNKEICELVEKIKILQKKYVRESDEEVLAEIKIHEKKLNEIPIYVIYMQHLEEVNKIKTFGLYSDIPGNLKEEKLLKYEEIMFDEKIQRITPIYMIKVKLIDTNLNGYQKTSKIKIFGEDIVKNLINELNKRNGTFYLNKEIWNAICRVERGRVSNKMRFYILERDHYRCRCCGRSQNEVDLEIDHIVPIAKGGKSTSDNLQTLCTECNKRKGTTIHRY